MIMGYWTMAGIMYAAAPLDSEWALGAPQPASRARLSWSAGPRPAEVVADDPVPVGCSGPQALPRHGRTGRGRRAQVAGTSRRRDYAELALLRGRPMAYRRAGEEDRRYPTGPSSLGQISGGRRQPQRPRWPEPTYQKLPRRPSRPPPTGWCGSPTRRSRCRHPPTGCRWSQLTRSAPPAGDPIRG